MRCYGLLNQSSNLLYIYVYLGGTTKNMCACARFLLFDTTSKNIRALQQDYNLLYYRR